MNSIRFPALIARAGGALLFATVSFAQAPTTDPLTLAKYDTNKNGRLEPEEIAAMVTWLCTEDCSFSTGAVFDLSGGRSTY